MNILQLPFGYYPDAVGGTEAYVAALAAGLSRRGVASLVAAPAEHAARSEHAGIPVRRFPLVQAVSDPAELYGAGDPASAAALGQILDEERPDVVHLHAFTRGVSLLALREARRRGLPVVFTYHTPTASCMRGTLLRWGNTVCDGQLHSGRCGACTLQGLGVPRAASELLGRVPPRVGAVIGRAGLKGGPWTALRMGELVRLRHDTLRALLAEADALVAVSAWVQALLLRNGAAPEKLLLSRHGLERPMTATTETIRPVGGPLRLAFLGRLDPTKGVDLLIAALQTLPQAPLTLDIYGVVQPGSEQYVARLHELAAGDGRIRFCPPVPGHEVESLLRRYDLLAVPSRVVETGPLVVLEAFAAGVPVLGAKLGGITELVRHEMDGLLVPPDDPAPWSEALARLLAEPALLPQLRAGVEPPRSIEDVVDEMLTLYRALTRSGPAEPSARHGAAAALHHEGVGGR